MCSDSSAKRLGRNFGAMDLFSDFHVWPQIVADTDSNRLTLLASLICKMWCGWVEHCVVRVYSYWIFLSTNNQLGSDLWSSGRPTNLTSQPCAQAILTRSHVFHFHGVCVRHALLSSTLLARDNILKKLTDSKHAPA